MLILIGISFIVGALAFPYMPDRVASHWNAQGTVDDYMSKFWGIFLLPIMLAAMFLIYIIIPKIDPLKSNIESFRKYYDAFWLALTVFLMYIFALVLAWNFGYRFNFSVMLIPAMAAFWYCIGGLLEKSKRNWFIGIRTPWTLSSDVVWEKTNALGGKLFKIAALFALFGLFFQNSEVLAIFIIVPLAGVALFAIVYSYIEYKKLPH